MADVPIDRLMLQSTLSAGDQILILPANARDARRAPMTALTTYVAATAPVTDGKVTQYAGPSATPFAIAITDSSSSVWLKLTPTVPIAVTTITLPSLANCVDRQEILVTTTQALSALTVLGNGAIAVNGAPAALAAGAAFKLRFDAVGKDWTAVV